MSKEFSGLVGPGGRVYALDTDEEGIAALKAETSGTNIVAIAGDITGNTGLPSAAFDLVYLSNVVHGFTPEQVPGFLAEAGRLLAPGGRLAVVEFAKMTTPFGPPVERRLSPEELKDLLGLAPVLTCDIGGYFYLQLYGRPDGERG